MSIKLILIQYTIQRLPKRVPDYIHRTSAIDMVAGVAADVSAKQEHITFFVARIP